MSSGAGVGLEESSEHREASIDIDRRDFAFDFVGLPELLWYILESIGFASALDILEVVFVVGEVEHASW